MYFGTQLVCIVLVRLAFFRAKATPDNFQNLPLLDLLLRVVDLIQGLILDS
jgi:hypothetical protein